MQKFDIDEYVGQFIDIFNDFLENKGITHEDLGNHEAADPTDPDCDTAAVICGSQYDELAEKIKELISTTN